MEHFLALQIDEARPGTPMEIEEVPQVQVTDNADTEKIQAEDTVEDN